MKIRSLGAKLFHADRQKDRRTEGQKNMKKLTVAFRNFAKATKKGRNDHTQDVNMRNTFKRQSHICLSKESPSSSFFIAQQPLVGRRCLNIEASRSLSKTPHSVGLLCPSHRLLPDNTTLTRHKHTCSWRDSISQSQRASGRRHTS
jgi:hypothetical protein